MKHLQGLPVLILGLGASGLAMARWCARHGARVTVADTRDAPPQLEALRRKVPAATFVAGAFSAALVEGQPVRALYRSPGLSPQCWRRCWPRRGPLACRWVASWICSPRRSRICRMPQWPTARMPYSFPRRGKAGMGASGHCRMTWSMWARRLPLPQPSPGGEGG